MKWTQAELLVELGRHYIEVAAMLMDTSLHQGVLLVSTGVRHAVVSIVLNLLNTHSQCSVGLLIGEGTLDAGTGLMTHAIVPPEVFGVVMTFIEGGIQSMNVGFGSQTDSIAKEWEIDIGTSVELQLS